MSKKSSPRGYGRYNISLPKAVKNQGKKIAKVEASTFSNLMATLIKREHERLFGKPA
jgi:hypothetical protein